ncbi:MAG: multicopper oxidase domain-containing protein [Acidimicrobiales bacterium]|nr:multicopper oxidase domain-containing protein [Acidimicrobiales bacterium]
MSEEARATEAHDTKSDPPNVALVLGVLAVAAAFALSISAIIMATSKDGGSGGGGGAASHVTVTLSEFAIEPGAITVAEGGMLMIENAGSVPHNLEVVGEDYATADIDGGASAELDLSGLPVGTYDVICTIAGHESSGMTGTLTVVAGGEEVATGDSGSSSSSGDHGAHMSEEMAAQLDQAMMDSMNAFPAETAGVGNEILEPEILEDGTKYFELTAEIVDWEVEPGKTVEAWTYNGTVPGPEIHLEVGDRVRIDLTNETPLGTDLHMHGVKLPNDMDGVAPYTQDLILPGETFTYEFTATKIAVAMYHAHVHGQESVPNGMLGMIYIGDMPIPDIETIRDAVADESVPDDVTIDQELSMVLNDAGTIGYALNGKSFPATAPVAGTVGDWVMVHYANEGVQIHPMHLHQMDQIVIAKDGIPLTSPYAVDTLNVGPGERYTVIFRMEAPGVWVWHCHILPHVERDTGMFGMVTAVIVEEEGEE